MGGGGGAQNNTTAQPVCSNAHDYVQHHVCRVVHNDRLYLFILYIYTHTNKSMPQSAYQKYRSAVDLKKSVIDCMLL